MSKKIPIPIKAFTPDRKLTIPKKYKKDIEFIRDVYKTHDTLQEFLITTLASRLEITKNSNDYVTLWDYIYNNSDWMIKFK
jgi:hypothetical protein